MVKNTVNKNKKSCDRCILNKIHKNHNSKNDDYDDDIDNCLNSISCKINNVHSINNHVYFHSQVNKKSIEMLIDEINKINNRLEILERNKLIDSIIPNPIYLHITSYGGSLLHCFKAVDVIKRSKVPIHTVIEGYAASSGSLMAVSGKKRYMGAYASQLIHQMSSMCHGKYNEIEDDYKNCKMWMDHIVQIYVDNSKMNRQQVIEQLKHDSWWNSDKCLDNGLVDELWTKN